VDVNPARSTDVRMAMPASSVAGLHAGADISLNVYVPGVPEETATATILRLGTERDRMGPDERAVIARLDSEWCERFQWRTVIGL
jgi:hypothetical protein